MIDVKDGALRAAGVIINQIIRAAS